MTPQEGRTTSDRAPVDVEAFGGFYDDTVARAYHLSLLFTRDETAAQDLTRRAYLRLATDPHATHDEPSLLRAVTVLGRRLNGPATHRVRSVPRYRRGLRPGSGPGRSAAAS